MTSKKILKKIYRLLPASLVRDFVILKREDFQPQIVVMMDGGLGSQMWQYAIGRGASIASGLSVSYDLSFYDNNGKDINGVYNRRFDLEAVFPDIALRRADKKLADFYKLYFMSKNKRDERLKYDESLLSSKLPRFLGGYYPNARYVDPQGDALREEFVFRRNAEGVNLETFRSIRANECAVAIHVRRGDYIGSVLDVVTACYFRRAVKLISERVSPVQATYYVFSNEISWCKSVFDDISEEQFVFVENNDNDSGFWDMYLMSHCHHFIISNSSFSWWPAWLSKRSAGKIVLMPDKWIAIEKPKDKGAMMAAGWEMLPIF